MELSYESNPDSYNEAYCTPGEVEAQLLPKAPTDVPIVVPSPLVDWARTCCPGCEGIDLAQVPLLPVEVPMENPFVVEEPAVAVRGQCACRSGGRSDSQRYGGVPQMQPLGGQQYPGRGERELG